MHTVALWENRTPSLPTTIPVRLLNAAFWLAKGSYDDWPRRGCLRKSDGSRLHASQLRLNMFSRGEGPRHGSWVNRGRGTVHTATIISDLTLRLVESGWSQRCVLAFMLHSDGLNISTASPDKQRMQQVTTLTTRISCTIKGLASLTCLRQSKHGKTQL